MSIVEEIGNRLGVLASDAAQERYMANATKDEYLLPVEAINGALDVLGTLGGFSPLAALHDMEPRTTIAVAKFASVWPTDTQEIDALLTLPWADLVRHNQLWKALRDAAKACLAEIGFDLAQWEKDEGYAA